MRIRRMVQPHKTRKELNVPPAVRDKWDESPEAKDMMAAVLKKVNFDKASFIQRIETIIRREKTVELIVDEAWYSEAEMESELHWSKNLPQRFMYDMFLFLQLTGSEKTSKEQNCRSSGSLHEDS
ncbi:unnamed protein product [Durusdinium trenchii]|uniref:Uncharacterized protein n=1 Tax=Durusdinium trenchii TaxID=1381693 RepID=A0ABP0I0Z9_9DINO